MSNIYPGGDSPVTPVLGLSLWGMDEVVADDMIILDSAFGAISTVVDVNGVPVTSPNFVNSASVTFSVLGSNISATASVATGTVTTFSSGNLSPLFTTSVATPSTTPALSFSLNTQANNTVFAGPITGGPLAPTFRALDITDLPKISFTNISGSVAAAQMPALTGDVTSVAGTVATTLSEMQGIPLLASGAEAPANGQILQYDGVNWTPTNPIAAAAQILYLNQITAINGEPFVLTQVSVSGSTTTYTGTITGGAANGYIGKTFVVTGFVTHTGNNTTFVATASTATTLVCTTTTQVNETNPATATWQYFKWLTSPAGTPQASTALSITAAMGATVLAAWTTAPGYPNITLLPSGNWQFDTYIQTSAAGGTQTMYFQVLKRDATTGAETALFDTSASPITISGNGTGIQFVSIEPTEQAFTLALTDTLVYKVWVTVSATRTITIYYDGTVNYSHVHTTIGTGASAPVTSVFNRTGAVVATAGDYPWNYAGNATGNLTLANANYTTEFDQTSAVNWTWANITASSVGPSSGGALVASGSILNGASTVTLNTVGSTLFVAVLLGYGAATTISDNLSNVWNYLTSYVESGTRQIRIAYAYGVNTSGSQIFTIATAGNYASAVVYAFSGTVPSSGVYDSSTGTSTATAPTVQPGSITPTAADIVVTGIVDNWATVPYTLTINDGFNLTECYASNGISVSGGGAYFLNAANSALNPTFTAPGTAACCAAIACFKTTGTVINNNSPVFNMNGTYWTGSASAVDTWLLQGMLGAGQMPTSTLSISHTGSSGSALVQVPALTSLGIVELLNTAIATGSTANASPMLEFVANYYTGSSSTPDVWTIGSSLAAGTNGVSTLTFSHTGSSGTSIVSVPKLSLATTQTPASNAAGIAGQVIYDANYIYVCIASGTWKRAALTGGY